MTRIITFGEIMGRLAPEGVLRFRQCLPGTLQVTFAGAEANVAVSISFLGGQSAFVTALPRNPIAEACVADLRSLGVDTRYILRTDTGRLGLYFLETGANQRASSVTYDRSGSAISITSHDRYPWSEILRDADWLHVTGITPALSKVAADATLHAVREARTANLRVSCDLNFRKALWRWDPSCSPNQLAEKTMREILQYADLVVANEEDAADVLGIRARDTDVHAGKVAVEHYPDVAREIVSQFPNLRNVAITLRESISASYNRWGAMIYDSAERAACFAPAKDGSYVPYEIRNIVDRVGGGDAFAAGLIFAMITPELQSPETAVAFAAAASCLAHSIVGDYNFVTRAEVESLMKGSGSGRVIR
jgi:2-dehydro-3-deoxygluconokinase